MSESVSILIPTHNRGAILSRTLASVGTLKVPSGVKVECIVVANACTDDTPRIAREGCAGLPIPARVVEESEVGLSAARNRGLREAAHDILAFIDDDVLLSPEWLEGLLEVYRSTPAGVVAGRVELWWEAVARPAWMTDTIEGLLSRTSHGDAVKPLTDPMGVVGANYSCRRAVYERIGGYRTDLGRKGASGMGAGEEGEWVRRALHAGFPLFYAPRSSLQHWVAPARVEPAYLRRVAIGKGWTNIAMKEHYGLTVAARAIVGHLYLGFKGAALELLAGLAGDRAAQEAQRSMRRIGFAGVAAGVRRLMGKPAIPDKKL